MADQTAWHQLFSLTERMVYAAEDDAWEQLGELQQQQTQLMASLPAPTSADASLLREILSLNQTLESLGKSQRDGLAEQLHKGQKNRQGINAYQSVTANCH